MVCKLGTNFSITVTVAKRLSYNHTLLRHHDFNNYRIPLNMGFNRKRKIHNILGRHCDIFNDVTFLGGDIKTIENVDRKYEVIFKIME